jgi:MoxR-like ATPase
MEKEKLNKKQRYALDTMLSGSNVFLTGDAGTGKQRLSKRLLMRRKKLVKVFLYRLLQELRLIISDMVLPQYIEH